MRHPAILTTALFGALLAAPAMALEVDPNVLPEINLGGRAIITTDFARTVLSPAGRDSESALDFADSSLLFGFNKYLFSDRDYGFAVIGFKTVEDDSEVGDQWYPHELNAGIGGRRYEVRLGRSRLPNTLVAFPTLRDDDLLAYTHVANGQSNADAEEYQVYGGQVAGSWWLTPFVRAGAAVTARTETDLLGVRTNGSSFNGAAVTIAYDVPEAIKFTRGVRFAGVTLEQQRLEALGTSPEEERNAVVAGAIVNLNDHPEAAWVLDMQAIVNHGAAVTGLGEPYQRARAESRAGIVALRFARRPALQTRWQAALTVGWKDYSDFEAASSYVVAPSYVYRLGSGVDLLGQYVYERHRPDLAAATGVENEHRLYLGLSFAIGYTINETVGVRGSILNIEHDTLDLGPVGGGH